MATGTEAAPATAGSSHLMRNVGLIGLLWASEGSIIGSGWLFGAQGALQTAGPAALIAWAIGAIIIIVLALVHAELGGMFPVAGGTTRFPHYSFGGAAGASFGWFSWLQAASVAPVEVIAMIQYAQHWHFADSWMYTVQNEGHTRHLLSHTGIVFAILIMAVMVGVNFFGVKALARVNNVATWWKVGIPLLTIFVLAITAFHTSNFSANGGFMGEGWKNILLAIPLSGIVFSLLGFEQAIQLAGESSNPKKHLPRATILSILIGAAIYILIQVVFIGALPEKLIAGGWGSTASTSFTQLAYPIAGVATAVSVGWLATVLYIDAVISPGGTALIYSTSTSRISFGLAGNGYVPAVYGRTNRQGVPWFGLITAFITGCIFFLPFPSWQSMVQLVTSASVMMYAGAPLAFGVFRDRLPEWDRPYRLPAGKVFAPLSFVLANLIILWSGWDTIYKLGISVLIGYIILIASRLLKLNANQPEMDFKAAQWLPVYLIGMGVIIWQSQNFDNMANLTGGAGTPNHPWFGFGWDMVAVAVFSLVIYYWAQAVALPTERIKSLIGEVVVVDEGGH